MNEISNIRPGQERTCQNSHPGQVLRSPQTSRPRLRAWLRLATFICIHIISVFNSTLQVLPWQIECTILVRTTPVTPVAGMTGIAIETTAEVGTTTLGMIVAVTTIGGPGTMTGGLKMFPNRKILWRYNILCSHKCSPASWPLGRYTRIVI